MRRLPLVVVPYADESLWSWIMRCSFDSGAPPGIIAHRLGLPVRPGWTGGARVVSFGVILPAVYRERVAAVAGLTQNQVLGMHLERFDNSAISLATIDWTDERTLSLIARSQWLLPYESRACPQCLSERHGVWPTWWKLGHAACCPTHGTMLLDACPDCGIPFTRGYRSTPRGLSVATVPDTDRCGNHTPHGPCQRVLSTLPIAQAGSALRRVQAVVLAAAGATTESTDQPLQFAGANLNPAEWFAVVRDLAAVAAVCLTDPVGRGILISDHAGEREPAIFESTQDLHSDDWPETPHLGVRYRGTPATAQRAAALLTLLADALLAPDGPGTRDALAPLGQAYLSTVRARGHDPLRNQPVSETVSGALGLREGQRRGRVVSVCGFAARAQTEAAVHAVAPATIPTRLIPQLITEQHWEVIRGLMPGTAALTGRRYVALAAARHCGAGTWAASATALGLEPRRAVVVADVVGRRIRDVGSFWNVVGDIVDDFARQGVDFRRRELALRPVQAVPGLLWRDWCAGYQYVATVQGARHAAATVWASVACGHPHESPAFNAPWPTGACRESRVEGFRRFVLRTPQHLLADIHAWGESVVHQTGSSPTEMADVGGQFGLTGQDGGARHA